MGCALFRLNQEKQLSHAPSPILEIKKTNQITAPPTHISKNNNTVAIENRTEVKWTL